MFIPYMLYNCTTCSKIITAIMELGRRLEEGSRKLEESGDEFPVSGMSPEEDASMSLMRKDVFKLEVCKLKFHVEPGNFFWRRHGKTQKFFLLKKKFRELYSKASKGHLRKNVDKLIKSRPGQAHKTLKKMGARPGEDDDSIIIELPEFKDRDLSRDQIAEEIGSHFAKISQ